MPSMRLRSEEHTSELQSRRELVCRLLLEKKNKSPLVGARRRHISPGQDRVRRPQADLPQDLRHLATRFRRRHENDGVADLFFFCNDTATTEIYTLSLHDALPIRSGAPRSVLKWPSIAASLTGCQWA